MSGLSAAASSAIAAEPAEPSNGPIAVRDPTELGQGVSARRSLSIVEVWHFPPIVGVVAHNGHGNSAFKVA